jgi:hypothetical protein
LCLSKSNLLSIALLGREETNLGLKLPILFLRLMGFFLKKE